MSLEMCYLLFIYAGIDLKKKKIYIYIYLYILENVVRYETAV